LHCITRQGLGLNLSALFSTKAGAEGIGVMIWRAGMPSVSVSQAWGVW
jgi:hypothetical protein